MLIHNGQNSICLLYTSAVVAILNTLWTAAIPTGEMALLRKLNLKMRLRPEKSIRKTTVPIRLKRMWITDTRFAFLFTPILEIIAVTQVPMFCPIITGRAIPKVILPVRESA